MSFLQKIQAEWHYLLTLIRSIAKAGSYHIGLLGRHTLAYSASAHDIETDGADQRHL